MTETSDSRSVLKGRGATQSPAPRYQSTHTEREDDGWSREDDAPPSPRTTVLPERSRSIISRNQSPEIPFEQSINPYRGCEHGCVYCYARPSHAYLDLSPGLDFETRLFYKPDAAALLEAELRKPGYRVSPISLGANTDPYQPVERRLGVTRSVLEVLLRFRHPVTIVTKGAALVERDLDLLQAMSAENLVAVAVSLTTLRPELKRTLEPRAASPAGRLRLMRQLSDAGIPVMVFFAPVIPFVNDAELEQVLDAASQAGARSAGYVMLRLPREVAPLFQDWLQVHEPLKAAHVLSLVRQMRGGRDNDPRFGSRMRGQGQYADLIARRFGLACRRLRLGSGARGRIELDSTRFRVPPAGGQLALEL